MYSIKTTNWEDGCYSVLAEDEDGEITLSIDINANKLATVRVAKEDGYTVTVPSKIIMDAASLLKDLDTAARSPIYNVVIK